MAVNNLTANAVKFLPMARLHERRVELLDERSDHIHVLDSVVQGLESLITLDFFVASQVGSSLVRLHALQQHLKVVCVNVVPESLLPGFELAVDNGDQIPHLLELNELVLAVIELLLLGSLEFEEGLQNVQFFSCSLLLASLFIVFHDLLVGVADNLRGSLLDVVRQVRLEFLSVLKNLDLEFTDSGLDVVRLLGLEGKNSFLDGSEGVVGGVLKGGP